MRTRLGIVCYLTTLILTLDFAGRASAAIDIAFLSGTASPDGNGALSLFSAPSMNNFGDLAFASTLTGTSGGTADNQALYRLTSSGLTHIARKGQSINGKSVLLFFSPYIDSAGTICDVPALSPTPATFTHFFSSGGPLTLMYTPGQSSPSGNNTLLGVNTAAVNDAGVSAYMAAYFGGNPEVGLYTRAIDGTVATRLLRNAPAPRGGTVTGISSRLTLNESGQIANILDISSNTTKSIARVGSTVTELARRGDLAADGITTIGEFSSEVSFTSDPIPIINDLGQIAFPAQYTQPASRIGVFLADDTGVRLVVPGNLPQGNATKMNVVGLSNDGHVALTTEFFGGSDPLSAVYLADTSGQTLIALEDAATPVPGKFFRSFFSRSTTINASGQLAFLAELSDTANGAAAGRGLYAYDATSGLLQIARTGDTFAGSTITNIFFNGTVLNDISVQSPDTSLSGLNSEGQIAFAFTLANGQEGIAVYSPSNIPGDYDGDGIVNTDDYDEWVQTSALRRLTPMAMLTARLMQPTTLCGRADGGAGAGGEGDFQSRAVPEPSSFALAVVSAILASLSRIRRGRIA